MSTDTPMTFQFSAAEPKVSKTLRQLAQSELGAALALARAEHHPTSPLHALRKHIKKTRGLLRLVAPVMPAFRRENAALGAAASGISGARDAEVMRHTLDRLSDDTPAGQAAAALLAALPPQPIAPPKALAEFANAVEAVHRRAAGWKLDKTGWEALAPGLEATAHEARNRMSRAQHSLDDEHFHAWRSRVKHHWYQARLLTPIWPEMMRTHADAAAELGEILGMHHDLYVLAQALPGPLAMPQANALAQRLEVEQNHLEMRAFWLGERLFAEPPEALSQRWGGWYAQWRTEAARPAC